MNSGHWILDGLYESAAMLWETLWALVLGLTVSSAIQVFVRKEAMEKALGGNGFRQVALATFFGAISSSCSYAAVAAARSAFKKGAGIVPTLAFMFASTNMVFELGAVMWVFLGWRFVLAEFVGAFFLIGFVWAIVSRTCRPEWVRQAREFGETPSEDGCHHHEHADAQMAGGWQQVGTVFVMEWAMLWKELVAGFAISGFLSVLVPNAWWQALFLNSGPHWLRTLENSIVGPIIAALSFVCSIGNVPLAGTLWSGGIGFGGVVSFIYADLIVIPVILIYRKQYGLRFALYITAVMFASMVLSGIAVDFLFGLFGLVPHGPRPPSAASMAHFQWNYTTWLNLVALCVVICLLVLRKKGEGRPGKEMA